MSERVVDHLEQIEVEHEDREPAAVTPQPGQRFLHFLKQHGAIGEAGQAVVSRHVGDLGFGPLLRGDVEMHGDPSAIGHRPVIDRERAAVGHRDLGIVWLAAANVDQASPDVGVAVRRTDTAGNASFQDRAQHGAWRRLFEREPVHLGVALVADDQTLVTIVHAQSVRHVLERGVEAHILRLAIRPRARAAPRFAPARVDPARG